MKFTPFLIPSIFLFLVCSEALAGWSMVERGIRKKIPSYFLDYADGPIVNPSDADVDKALELATISKEKRDILEYAFIHKFEKPPKNTQFIYLTAKTPLYLIAAHIRERLREYKELDIIQFTI